MSFGLRIDGFAVERLGIELSVTRLTLQRAPSFVEGLPHLGFGDLEELLAACVNLQCVGRYRIDVCLQFANAIAGLPEPSLIDGGIPSMRTTDLDKLANADELASVPH